jgi:ABC-2 type transport system permease protein
MYNYFVQAWSTYKGLFYWLNWPGYISNVFLRPMVMVLTYALLGRFALDLDAARDYSLGIGIYSMMFILVGAISQSYTYDRFQGTIAFLYISPANRLVNYLSRMLLHIPNALLVFIFGFGTACLLVNINFGLVNWLAFILSVFITACSIAAFGQAIGVAAIALRNWMNTFGLILGLFIVLTGVIIPLSVFPPVVREICKLLPMTNGLIATRLAFAGGAFSSVCYPMLREALTGLVYLFIGYIGFGVFETIVKHNGALEEDIMN